jgi:benzoate-CoA ligase family protein
MGHPPVSIPQTFNVAEYFIDRNLDEGRGGRTAIFFQDQNLSYGQVAEQVRRASNALQSGGIAPGDRVMILLYDSPNFVTTFWGAIRMGAIPVPANTMLSADECAFMLRDSGARGLVIEEKLFQKVAASLGQLRNLKSIWIAGAGPSNHINLEGALAQCSPVAAAARTRRDDPAFWLYTSGSTGNPKAAVHRHRDMVYCFELYARQVLGIGPQDITFSTSKLYFAYGLGNALYFPFGVGASTVLLADRPTPEKIFDILVRLRPTIFYAVPTIYASLLKASGVEASHWASVRRAVSAGEALPAPVWTRFKEKFGVSILDGIGSTEILHMFISNRPGECVPGCSGKLVPGYEARIVNELGADAPPGQVGELHIRGASTAAGYWNREELTRATFRGDWSATGDKYFRDGNGYFWYCGRSDDMMKVSGLWVSPVEVESALLAHPAVHECAVVGVVDNDGLTKPKAFVVFKNAELLNSEFAKVLIQFLRTQLPGYKVPQWIVQADRLPRTATGKIQRFKLRTMQHEAR